MRRGSAATNASPQRDAQMELHSVLDACCGGRMMWFDKDDPRALFIDRRREVHAMDLGTPGTARRQPLIIEPSIQASFTALPFADETFRLVVFDPPHLFPRRAGNLLNKKYGVMKADWLEQTRGGFSECFRVLKDAGILIFKWSDGDVQCHKILRLALPHKPLFGTRRGRQTHWIVFMKGTA